MLPNAKMEEMDEVVGLLLLLLVGRGKGEKHGVEGGPDWQGWDSMSSFVAACASWNVWSAATAANVAPLPERYMLSVRWLGQEKRLCVGKDPWGSCCCCWWWALAAAAALLQ